MTIRIEDGLGTGKTAGVDSSNRLRTTAVTVDSLSEQSGDGQAFILHAEHAITTSDVENVLYFCNSSSTKNIGIHSIVVATYDGYEDPTRVRFAFESARVSGGTAYTPLNLNRLSARQSEATVYIDSSNLILIRDDTKTFTTLVVNSYNSTAIFEPRGAFILGPNNTFSVTTKGPIGETLYVSVSYTEATEL